MANNTTNILSAFLNTTPSISPPRLCDSYTGDGEMIAYAVFLAVVMALSVLGNTLVCLAIALSPRLQENATNYFIASLAVSDLCYAIFQSPIRISTILHQRSFCFSEEVCTFYVITDLIATPATITTLFVITMDRFFCITSPFWYQEVMTKFKAIVIIAFVWIYACFWASMSTFKWDTPDKGSIKLRTTGIHNTCINENKYFYMASYFLVTLIPLVVMAILYIIILNIALTQIKAIRATEIHLQPRELNDNETGKRNKKPSKTGRRTNRELKATATLAIVYGAFFVCWVPLLVINLVIGFGGAHLFTKLRTNNGPLFDFVYYFFVEILPTMSTFINPIIYNVFNRKFRAAFYAVILRMISRQDLLHRSTFVTEFSRSDAGTTIKGDHPGLASRLHDAR